MAAINKSPVKAAYWLAAENNVFTASQIRVSLFTHLFCGFATVRPPTYRVEFPWHREPFMAFSEIVKQKKSDMKTILSIGGKNSPMPSDDASREVFIKSSIRLARDYGFDGLDLCWIYPNSQSEMENLGTLLGHLRAAIAEEAAQSKHLPPLLLTAAVYFSPKISDSLIYPIEEMKKSLDWVNVTGYNLTDPIRSPDATAAPAPLVSYGPNNVSGGVEEWVSRLSPSMLVLGLPFFGYAWNLVHDPKEYEIGAPAEGPYYPQPSVDGLWTYRDISKLVDYNGFTHVYQPKFVADYCYQDRMWVAYDGPETPDTEGAIKTKVLYAKNEKGLLGYFAWTVGWDGENSELAATAFNTWG